MPYANREDQLAAQRRWYEKNKKKQKRWNKEWKDRVREWFREYKATLKCCQCPENHPSCLDFHHPDENKEGAIGSMVANGVGKERILAEIKKCDVLCSNCHRKLHAGVV